MPWENLPGAIMRGKWTPSAESFAPAPCGAQLSTARGALSRKVNAFLEGEKEPRPETA